MRKKASQYLKNGLNENGFIVDVADNGMEGVFYEKEYVYDVIVLDIMLPKLDGWSST